MLEPCPSMRAPQAMRNSARSVISGGVFQHGFAVGQNRRHQQVLRAADRRHVEGNVGPRKFVAAAEDIAVFQVEAGSHFFHALEVLIHRTRADGAPAGQGHAGLPDARQQGAQTEHGSPHGFDQLVRRFRLRTAGTHMNHAGLVFGRTSQDAQQLQRGMDIPKVGHIGEGGGLFQQNGSEEKRQRGIF